MLKVGLTGGIACGKSTVAEMFVKLGAHVIKADELGHRLMRPGQPVYRQIVQSFGREILNGDGTISREKLAALAFAPGHSRIAELNRIVHPAVIAEQERWVEEVGQGDPNAVVMVEAALILEAGIRHHFDRLVVVACAPEQKVVRLAQRLQTDVEAARREVERRSAAQLPDAEKERQADFVIDNNGSIEEAARQVERIFSALKGEAETRHPAK